ncbi:MULTISPECIES: Fic family protein [Bizionia]|uniref:Cell filamentation protein Fic n=1 Tax=Bizionia algoritergicola TaxID=291187 RepID=A0A5D0QXD2_9FLAO|nr:MULTISPECIES: Fic family protein [Bizionia]OBX23330.1 cell filamentation protein Fic [Bizionia sp. APA-3]TYB73321.1 cell filamentation protein Fic [Bizionia algoritergicola]UPS91308.1 cell filamentation protein Fic [Bizionia sp. M204]
MNNYFSQQITVFHNIDTPEPGTLAGYALLLEFLIQEKNIAVPMPSKLAIVTDKHQRYNTDRWQVFTKRHKPNKDIISHIVFAIKYEGIDLYILKQLFLNLGEGTIKEYILSEPTGQYARRIWFLYEWLLGKELDILDLKTGTYVEVVNEKLQYPGPTINSTRHRVKNNLPGTRDFCPMIHRTDKIETFQEKDFSNRMAFDLKGKDKDLIRRTAAFLLLKDSKASFAIEGEKPENQRARNWGKAIGQAGKKEVSLQELERLQNIVIGKNKLKQMGLRTQEGFIGEHDRETFAPIPDHISAKVQDLPVLMNGLIETNKILNQSQYDPVLMATVMAFGFVFIHPFSDGNGRLHRYLMHHILIRKNYTTRDMIFPISAAILNNISKYQEVLEAFSEPRLELIDWTPTEDHNVKILNETIDLYRYADLTLQAEFLYACVEETIEEIIPNEIKFLEQHDEMAEYINAMATLPNTDTDLLIKFLIQNNGKLSQAKKDKFFEELSDEILNNIEKKFAQVF